MAKLAPGQLPIIQEPSLHYLVNRCAAEATPTDPPESVCDVFMFKIKLSDEALEVKEALSAYLKEMVKKHSGEFCDCDLFDGKEHGYIELGGWIGNQQTAIVLIGIGKLLGLWEVFTPNLLDVPDGERKIMAGNGMVSIVPLESAPGLKALIDKINTAKGQKKV